MASVAAARRLCGLCRLPRVVWPSCESSACPSLMVGCAASPSFASCDRIDTAESFRRLPTTKITTKALRRVGPPFLRPAGIADWKNTTSVKSNDLPATIWPQSSFGCGCTASVSLALWLLVSKDRLVPSGYAPLSTFRSGFHWRCVHWIWG